MGAATTVCPAEFTTSKLVDDTPALDIRYARKGVLPVSYPTWFTRTYTDSARITGTARSTAAMAKRLRGFMPRVYIGIIHEWRRRIVRAAQRRTGITAGRLLSH